jgi:uroporphyrin-3 C-methyltransferase
VSKDKPTTKDAAVSTAGSGAAGSTAGAGAGKASKPGKPPKPNKPPKEKKPGRGAMVLAVFAFLLAAAAIGGAGYLWDQQQQLITKQTALAQQQGDALDKEQFAALERPAFDSSQIEANLVGLSERIETVDVGLSAAQRESAEVRQLTEGDIDRLAMENADLMQRVVEIGRTNRDDWRLAEVEYLLRLAHQRVVMGGELASAEALLADADNVMYELNMAGLLHVRRQVALDLAAVRAAAELDVTGLYLQLSALQEQIGGLTFAGISTSLDSETGADASADQASEDGDWREATDELWDKTVSNFRQYVVVQKPDEKPLPLLTTAGQDLIRVQLSLKLEQAKNALLLRQRDIFDAALGEAIGLVRTHFMPEDAVTLSLVEGLAAVQDNDIEPDLPDISASQQAIRGFIDKTYQSRNQLAPLDEEVSQ